MAILSKVEEVHSSTGASWGSPLTAYIYTVDYRFEKTEMHGLIMRYQYYPDYLFSMNTASNDNIGFSCEWKPGL